MAWTQSDIDALKKAFASGATEISYSNGKKVVFRSVDEFNQLLAQMEKEVNPSTSGRVAKVRYSR